MPNKFVQEFIPERLGILGEETWDREKKETKIVFVNVNEHIYITGKWVLSWRTWSSSAEISDMLCKTYGQKA